MSGIKDVTLHSIVATGLGQAKGWNVIVFYETLFRCG